MISRWFFKVFILLLLGSSCINGEQTYRADHTHLLSGGNSKVWMLSATRQHQEEQLKRNSWGEVLFVFYLSGEVLIGSFGDLAKGTFDKGTFSYQEDKEELTIRINSEKWKFKMSVASEDKLLLKTLSGPYLAPFMQLVPLTLPD
jgi:hypothetical protein